MDNKIGFFGYILLIISAIFIDTPISAKEKINLSAGLGQTELINAGIRGQINQTQLALSLGTLFMGEFAISGDVFFHFAGHSDFTERHPWYLRSGISFIHFKEDYPLLNLFSLGLLKNEPVNITAANLRFGRDFNISENIGINADFGLQFILKGDFERAIFGHEKEISQVFSASIFYRFRKN